MLFLNFYDIIRQKELIAVKRPTILRKIAAGLCSALLVMSVTSCSKGELHEVKTEHKTKVPPKMMFLGDSIAAGYGLDGYKADDNYNCPSYSNILKNKYTAELKDECGHTMVNKAVSGYTSDDLIAQIDSGELDTDLKDSDAVVVSIGGNDLLGIMLRLFNELGVDEKGSFDKDNFDIMSAATAFMGMSDDVDAALDKFSVNIKTISEKLNERTDGTIYIQTIYDPIEYFSQFSMVTDFSGEKLGKLNNIIAENSGDGYKVIDVASDFKGRAGELTNISKFDIHPNASGHEVIAEKVDRAFRETGFTYVTVEKLKDEPSYGGAVICVIAGVGVLIIIALAAVRKKSNK